MRQLFKRALVVVPLLVLAIPDTGFAQVYGRAWSQALDSAFFVNETTGDTLYLGKWNIILPLDASVLRDWRTKVAATSKWHTDEDCQAAMGYASDALAEADIQAGISREFAGEYFGPNEPTDVTNDADVIIVGALIATVPDGFGTLIHEAWHRSTGATENDITALNEKLDTLYNGRSLEGCYDENREEEDDEPGEGGGESTETCEDVWRPALTTTVPVWVV
ncbi:MAG: hypothetical protein OXI71_00810, partial [Gemmatimonadota bacterium]|nr:hypothetical protein [Gemmatimonadota bacterium]